MSKFLKKYEEPFVHWTVDEFLTPECLAEVKSIYHEGHQVTPGKRADNKRLFVHDVKPDVIPNLYALAEGIATGHYRLFFEQVTGQSFEGTFPRIEIISDIGEFELKPHHDHLEKKLSAMVYTDYSQLYPGTVLGDDYVVEAKDNRCMFFVPSEDTWHHYPKTNFETVRRALMINYWTYKV